MKMRENMGTHHELAYFCAAVVTSLQDWEYLPAAMSLNSCFFSGSDAGHSTVFFLLLLFFNVSNSLPSKVIQAGVCHLLCRKCGNILQMS